VRFVILLAGYAEEGTEWERMTPEEQQVYLDGHEAFDKAFAAQEGCEILAGEALSGAEAATVLRLQPGQRPVLTDGCYTESTEQVGGFYLVQVPDLDTLVELCTQLPPYVLELRPVIDVG
jgi:hypothetical protein